LGVVALELGYATPQHYSLHFRKSTGESPSAWRARSRRKVTRTSTEP
jgi:AraC-like DNA-binding protein